MSISVGDEENGIKTVKWGLSTVSAGRVVLMLVSMDRKFTKRLHVSMLDKVTDCSSRKGVAFSIWCRAEDAARASVKLRAAVRSRLAQDLKTTKKRISTWTAKTKKK